jgi:hypothetical protein
MKKPGQVQAISIYTLIVGIINILVGCGWMITIFGIPIGAYSIVVGILEIIYATKILPDPIKPIAPARYVAIMEIVNVVSFSFFSLAAGIISLVFYSDPKVIAYFNHSTGQAAPGTGPTL